MVCRRNKFGKCKEVQISHTVAQNFNPRWDPTNFGVTKRSNCFVALGTGQEKLKQWDSVGFLKRDKQLLLNIYWQTTRLVLSRKSKQFLISLCASQSSKIVWGCEFFDDSQSLAANRHLAANRRLPKNLFLNLILFGLRREEEVFRPVQNVHSDKKNIPEGTSF